MDFLPLFFNVKGRTCLIVGGGEVAARKASLIARAGGRLRAVAPEILEELQALVKQTGGECISRDFAEQDLDNADLVIAATDLLEVNEQVSKLAQARSIPVNVVDQPHLCSFIVPAIVDRTPIVVAVSSGGQSPVLARLLRAKLESIVPSGYGRLAKLVGGFRDQVKAKLGHINQRRSFWESVLQGPVAEQVFAGKDKLAAKMMADALDKAAAAGDYAGEVYLVGGGPGDPDLMTFRALRLMQQADVVLYDRLVSQQVLDLCRRDADMIHVGKARKNHTMPQEEINALLVRLAKEGKRVLRLKGGDPFIFGRGGEEIDQLMEHGIPFQVVPGITAASGCAAYAGIPLTHRDCAQSVRFLTGHLKNDTCDLPWDELASDQETLVFYMGLVSLPQICLSLIEHGKRASTPVAVISKGTLAEQRVVVGTLENIAQRVTESAIVAPTLTIMGDVVKLRDKLEWFESQAQFSGE